MTKAEKWQRTRLIGFECGFGFFAGDTIEHPRKGTGRVSCVFRESGVIPIVWGDNTSISTYHARNDRHLDKTGRVAAPLFPKVVLKWIYEQYNLENKIFFMYHWKGANKQAAEATAEYLHVSLSKIKSVLQSFRDRGCI